MERTGIGFDVKTEELLRKTSVLSYYIATYNAVSGEMGLDGEPVTVDEIFDFINDLRHEAGVTGVQGLTKSDISLTFKLLVETGLGRQDRLNLVSLSN